MAEQKKIGNTSAGAGWNRRRVSRYLLPLLKFADCRVQGERETVALHRDVMAALAADPEGYRQLLRVYHKASDDARDTWFGWLLCEEGVLKEAFDVIDRLLTQPDKTQVAEVSMEKDNYFVGLFHIREDEGRVDLAAPFEQYYFCDELLCRDYAARRLVLAERCRTLIRQYRPYYQRIRRWYKSEGEGNCPITPEHHAYMALYDELSAAMAYEDRLEDDRQALEYEQGGLGWFQGARKKEIRRELDELELEQLRIRLEKAKERYEALENECDRLRYGWEEELYRAPLTAFARRRELKLKLAALDDRLARAREELALDELAAEYNKKSKRRQDR